MEGQYFSQFGEDKWIVDNLHYPLNGIFVDVGASDGIYTPIKVQSRTLEDLLVLHDIDKIELLDIDVEGSEIDVWNSFDPEVYQPEVVVIEYSDARECCNKTEIISVITEYPYNLAYIYYTGKLNLCSHTLALGFIVKFDFYFNGTYCYAEWW